MGTRKINGFHLKKMLENGLYLLQSHEDEINKLNVFPVPDGDTGTNMRLTLENGIRRSNDRSESGAFLKSLSAGMLLGARGNSGVILSQFFTGFFQELSHCNFIGPGELRNGLIRGYRIAYQSVINPVEGTILSVAREGIENIRTQIGRSTSIDTILSMYVAEMKKTLAYTPEMLAVLKEAGVVDSGAKGFICIFEGMLKYLYGEIVQPDTTASSQPDSKPELDFDLFNEYSDFDDGYCMEFILQLMVNPRYNQNFDIDKYIGALQNHGNSLVVVRDGKRVKVHIHTKKPSKIIEQSQRFGEFLTFKLENMQLQHNEHDIKARPKEHKELSIVSVVNGKGLKDLFTELGSDLIIDGGSTMNTSSQEFVEAFKELDADNIVVLPNNSNIILAAEQAAELSGLDNITVIKTKSFAEGYYALAMDDKFNSTPEERIEQMKSGMEDVVTLSQTVASRDYSYHEISCKKGEDIALINNELVCVSSDWLKAIVDGLRHVPDIEMMETLTVMRGDGISEEKSAELERAVNEEFPHLTVETIDGGQQIYHFIIGII
ncbi:MAG: DAK2 domain-containing protein [Ruminococcus sp.]|nr:DAK2 domain-containing protein [Ruminococcus sp.]